MTTELTHLIGGSELKEELFEIKGTFKEYPITFEVPRLSLGIVEQIYKAMDKAEVPSLRDRLNLIEKLAEYHPSNQILEEICKMTGMPISWVDDMINKGKKMAKSFSERESADSDKIVFVGISPNDPREYFYFISHFLLAGSPSIIKPSSREPVLCLDILRYLNKQGMPPGLVNIIYGDTSNRNESQLIKQIINYSYVPIVMGDAKLSQRQISFNADWSRGLILEADAAIPHLKDSVFSPNSCLAEHNYFVIDEKNNYEKICEALINIYKHLHAGNILDPKTTVGETDVSIREKVANVVLLGTMTDTVKVLYSNNSSEIIDAEYIKKGILVEHFSEDADIGANLLSTTSLPLYITCIRRVPNLRSAFRDMLLAKRTILANYSVEKSMALGVYGDIGADILSDLKNLAFDIHINKSPINTKGIYHQGIDLNKILTRKM